MNNAITSSPVVCACIGTHRATPHDDVAQYCSLHRIRRDASGRGTLYMEPSYGRTGRAARIDAGDTVATRKY
jgi:hypothetical protein